VGARTRFRLVVVPDHSPRPIATKLLDRPDLIRGLRGSFADRPAFIESWNVTQREVQVAVQLQVPIDGPGPDLWHLGFKSSGRRLFRQAGIDGRFGLTAIGRTPEQATELYEATSAAVHQHARRAERVRPS
jgi:hypothetical protein